MLAQPTPKREEKKLKASVLNDYLDHRLICLLIVYCSMKMFLICLAISCKCFSQYSSSIRFKTNGTLIVSALSSEGIVIAADSRVSFTRGPRPNPVLAYYDSAPKLFKVKDCCVMAIFGNPIIGTPSEGKCYEIHTYFEDFDKSELVRRDGSVEAITDPIMCLKKFYSFINYKYKTIKEYFTPKNIQIYCFGYYRDTATMSCLDSNYNCITQDLSKHPFLTHGGTSSKIKIVLNSKFSAKKMGDSLEKYITDFARLSKYEDEIGGPISIVEIPFNDSIFYIKNDLLKNKINSSTEIKNMYFNNQLNITYIKPENKNIVDDIMNNFK